MTTPPLTEKPDLNKVLDDLYRELDGMNADTAEYATMVDQLVKLHKLKMDESPRRLSLDTLATIAANLGGILIIVAYEQKHILNSKAIGFIRRLG